VYVDMTYMKSESNAQIAYSGTLETLQHYRVITLFYLNSNITQLVVIGLEWVETMLLILHLVLRLLLI